MGLESKGTDLFLDLLPLTSRLVRSIHYLTYIVLIVRFVLSGRRLMAVPNKCIRFDRKDFEDFRWVLHYIYGVANDFTLCPIILFGLTLYIYVGCLCSLYIESHNHGTNLSSQS